MKIAHSVRHPCHLCMSKLPVFLRINLLANFQQFFSKIIINNFFLYIFLLRQHRPSLLNSFAERLQINFFLRKKIDFLKKNFDFGRSLFFLKVYIIFTTPIFSDFYFQQIRKQNGNNLFLHYIFDPISGSLIKINTFLNFATRNFLDDTPHYS